MAARIYLNAVGIHCGGGLTLLREFARAAVGQLAVVAIDARLSEADRRLFSGADIRLVPARLIARITTSFGLAEVAGDGDVLFSFASLPPLQRTRARSVVYVHAPHLAGLTRDIAYPAAVAARIGFEKMWFATAAPNADVFWVQTDSMARALRTKLPGAVVRILPFVSRAVLDPLASQACPAPRPIERAYFYPADGVAHKNHSMLLRAWSILAAEGFRPSLSLTLTAEEFARSCAAANIRPDKLSQVTNLGRLAHAEVLSKFAAGSSLIFPSLSETFGLPLLEAAAAGAQLVVAEREYSRDVVTPNESFDPTSARSIADAIRRHLGCPRRPPVPFDAAHVVAELLA